MCVCLYVRQPAAGPAQPITPKFGVGSSFHLGSAPSQGATQKVGPLPCPHPRPRPRPLLLLSSLDQSARDYFTIVLWNSPGLRRVAHACIVYNCQPLFSGCLLQSASLPLVDVGKRKNEQTHTQDQRCVLRLLIFEAVFFFCFYDRSTKFLWNPWEIKTYIKLTVVYLKVHSINCQKRTYGFWQLIESSNNGILGF